MKEPEELTEKEEELMERLLKTQKMSKWLFLAVILVLVPKIIMDFLIASRVAEEAGIESMWVTALGTNYQTTEMYSGAAFIVAKHLQQCFYFSLLTVGFFLFSFLIHRRQKLAIKLWKIVKSNELTQKDGGADNAGSDTGGFEGGETEVGGSEDK